MASMKNLHQGRGEGGGGIPFVNPNEIISHMQVIMVASEKDTGGFLAPSITILARDGWKGNATVDKCQERLSKLNFSLRQKL